MLSLHQKRFECQPNSLEGWYGKGCAETVLGSQLYLVCVTL